MGRLDVITQITGDINAGLDEVAAEVTKIADQLAAGAVTPEEIAAAETGLRAVADRIGGLRTDVDQLIEVEGEDVVAPPPTEPPAEPAPEGAQPTP
jgi:hypothetical protein